MHANCLPQFKSEHSICIQKVSRLLPTTADECLITRLMQTFSTPCSNELTKELQHYIQAFFDEHDHVFAHDKDELAGKLTTKFSWNDDTWGSTGQKQLLIVLTLLFKIQNSDDIKYICLDEALSGLDA